LLGIDRRQRRQKRGAGEDCSDGGFDVLDVAVHDEARPSEMPRCTSATNALRRSFQAACTQLWRSRPTTVMNAPLTRSGGRCGRRRPPVWCTSAYGTQVPSSRLVGPGRNTAMGAVDPVSDAFSAPLRTRIPAPGKRRAFQVAYAG